MADFTTHLPPILRRMGICEQRQAIAKPTVLEPI